MDELAEKLKAMGWQQVVTIEDHVEVPHDTFYVDFKLTTPGRLRHEPKDATRHWRGELRQMHTGKWRLILRPMYTFAGDTYESAREVEVLDIFDDPVAATVTLKIEGSGNIAEGVRQWRGDTFGSMEGELREISL